MSIDTVRIAAALRVLADAIEGTTVPATPAGEPAAATEAPKRGRGRPAKGEAPAPAVPAANTAAGASSTAGAAPSAATGAPAGAAGTSPSDDPFASDEAPAAPAVTLDQVREALVALKNRSDQATALKVLAAAGGGAKTLGDLKADLYGAVVAAAIGSPVAAQAEPDDPFATTVAPAQEAVPTAEELKALVIATGKRTSQDTVQKIVMKHGGKAPDPAGGPEKPSFKALPVTAYLAVAAELKALPSTK